MRKAMILLFAAMFVASSAMAISIDGDLLDWDGVPEADVGTTAEALGDMPTGPEFDIGAFYITSDTTNIYCRVDIDPSATFANGFLNYEYAPAYELWFGTNIADTVGLGWDGFWTFAPDYRIDLAPALDPSVMASEVTVYKYASDWSGPEELYDSVGVAQIALNGDGNAFEISVPRATLGQLFYGGWLMPMCYFVGNENWDNEEYCPNGAADNEPPEYAIVYNSATGELSNKLVGGSDWAMDAITVDGDMLDWDAIPSAGTGPTAESLGDSPSGPEFDIADFKMASDSTNFYGYLSIDPSQTFTDGWTNYDNPPILELYLDTTFGDTTGLTYGWWPLSINYFVELMEATDPSNPATEVTVMHYVGPTNGPVGEWGDNFVTTGTATVAINGDDNAMEFSIPWDVLNAGQYFNVVLSSLGNWQWGDDDFVPNGWNVSTGPAYALTYSKYDGAMNTLILPSAEAVGDQPASAARPENYKILSTYPNPFNSTTRISYTVPTNGNVKVAVYDIQGRLVNTLFSGAVHAGQHQAVWEGNNSVGNTVSSGVYLIRVTGDAGQAVARTVLIK